MVNPLGSGTFGLGCQAREDLLVVQYFGRAILGIS